MDQAGAPLLEALAEYHKLGRYGSPRPDIVKEGAPILG